MQNTKKNTRILRVRSWNGPDPEASEKLYLTNEAVRMPRHCLIFCLTTDLSLTVSLKILKKLTLCCFISTVPEEAPSFLKGHPLNSTAIHVSWKSLPPSRHKEQLLGYRVKYKRIGSQLYKEQNVTNNFTETVLTRLAKQTEYEIKVNGFNEIGDGPSTKILVVETVTSGMLEISCSYQLSKMLLKELRRDIFRS